MKTNNLMVIDNIFGMIKDLDADVKLELITRITASLKNDQRDIDDDWKKLFGAWESEENAETIIEEIRANRSTSRNIEDL